MKGAKDRVVLRGSDRQTQGQAGMWAVTLALTAYLHSPPSTVHASLAPWDNPWDNPHRRGSEEEGGEEQA